MRGRVYERVDGDVDDGDKERDGVEVESGEGCVEVHDVVDLSGRPANGERDRHHDQSADDFRLTGVRLVLKQMQICCFATT